LKTTLVGYITVNPTRLLKIFPNTLLFISGKKHLHN